jgi:hypothetical protein
MFIDTVNVRNQGVLKYLSRGEKSLNAVIAEPNSVKDPYLSQGSHPDIVQRVWDEIGAILPKNCRCLIYGTPAIVHDRTGIVIAICNGTQYNLRLTADDLREAIAKGAATQTRWSNGEVMDSLEVLGADWIFGGWFKEEDLWCRDTYNEHGSANPYKAVFDVRHALRKHRRDGLE